MKVFISWSGDLSHRVALALRDWMPSVLQSLEPYVSSEDIDKGARWSTDISAELEGSNSGVLVVTRSNINAPWLNFEAGALSKSFDNSRVSPFLFGVKRSDVQGPLLQFQSTIYDKSDIAKLMASLNDACGDQALDAHRLDEVIEVWWPRLELTLDPLLPEAEAEPLGSPSDDAVAIDRPDAAVLEEVLDLVRRQQKILSQPTEILPPPYLRDIVMEASERMGPRSRRGHPAFRDLERSFADLRSLATRLPDQDTMIEIQQVIEHLEGPVGYILSEWGRGSKGERW
jgi:hypothetical protein